MVNPSLRENKTLYVGCFKNIYPTSEKNIDSVEDCCKFCRKEKNYFCAIKEKVCSCYSEFSSYSFDFSFCNSNDSLYVAVYYAVNSSDISQFFLGSFNFRKTESFFNETKKKLNISSCIINCYDLGFPLSFIKNESCFCTRENIELLGRTKSNSSLRLEGEEVIMSPEPLEISLYRVCLKNSPIWNSCGENLLLNSLNSSIEQVDYKTKCKIGFQGHFCQQRNCQSNNGNCGNNKCLNFSSGSECKCSYGFHKFFSHKNCSKENYNNSIFFIIFIIFCFFFIIIFGIILIKIGKNKIKRNINNKYENVKFKNNSSFNIKNSIKLNINMININDKNSNVNNDESFNNNDNNKKNNNNNNNDNDNNKNEENDKNYNKLNLYDNLSLKNIYIHPKITKAPDLVVDNSHK